MLQNKINQQKDSFKLPYDSKIQNDNIYRESNGKTLTYLVFINKVK